MKKLLLILTVLFNTSAFAQQSPFAGNWIQSDLEHLSGAKYINAVPSKLEIKLVGGNLEVLRTSLTGNPQQPETSSKEVLVLDGKTVKTLTEDKRTKALTVKAGTDKRSLLKETLLSAPGEAAHGVYASTEEWTVSADGQTLTILKKFTNQTDDTDQWSVKATYTKS